MLLNILSGKVGHANRILNTPLRGTVSKLYTYKETDEADAIVDGLTTAQYTLLSYFHPKGEIFNDIKQYSIDDIEKLYVLVTTMSIYDSVANDLLDQDTANESFKFMPKMFNISVESINDYMTAIIDTQAQYDSTRKLMLDNGFKPASIGFLLWSEIRNILHTLPEYDLTGKDMMKALKQKNDFDTCYSVAFLRNKYGKLTLTVN